MAKNPVQPEEFSRVVKKYMQKRNMDYAAVVSELKEHEISISETTLKNYLSNRPPGLQLVIGLSQVLGVSIDELVGNDIPLKIDGFDGDYESEYYRQYEGKYNMYFLNTREHRANEIVSAVLTIVYDVDYKVTLQIPVEEEKDSKQYRGKLLLSENRKNLFIHLVGEHGEAVQLIMNTQTLNKKRFRIGAAAMVSVSSGSLAKYPVCSRAIVARDKLNTDNKILQAHLLMNSKSIYIEESRFKEATERFFSEIQQDSVDESFTKEQFICRIQNAFIPKRFLNISEAYLTSTIKEDYQLSTELIENLVASLRLLAIDKTSSSKVPPAIDNRLFQSLLKEKQ